MTNEEKALLLQDLCARLPYGIFVKDRNRNIPVKCDFECHPDLDNLENIKPYLRPISSMTEEEKKEFTKVLVKSQNCSYENNESATTIVNDWYLSKGFDVRGLIPMGLALEAKEDMYIKE